jgi:hypothetical protein
MNNNASIQVGSLTFANELFENGYPAGHSPCACVSECCAGGVFIDLKERDVILEHQEMIVRRMDETQTTDVSRWFEPEVQEDPDYPSGQCIGTEVYGDKCVFLDKAGRCAIQLAAVAEGLDRWAWKPMYCVLYPIEISEGVVGFNPMLQGEQRCCSVKSQFEVPLFQACRAELVHLIGNEGFAALEEHYRGLEKRFGSGNNEI